jgi:hypothetical protein
MTQAQRRSWEQPGGEPLFFYDKAWHCFVQLWRPPADKARRRGRGSSLQTASCDCSPLTSGHINDSTVIDPVNQRDLHNGKSLDKYSLTAFVNFPSKAAKHLPGHSLYDSDCGLPHILCSIILIPTIRWYGTLTEYKSPQKESSSSGYS